MMPDRCPLPPPRTESAPLQRYNAAMRSRVGATGASSSAAAGGGAAAGGYGMHGAHHNLSAVASATSASGNFPARLPVTHTPAGNDATTTTTVANDATRKTHLASAAATTASLTSATTTSSSSSSSSNAYHHHNNNVYSNNSHHHTHHHHHMQHHTTHATTSAGSSSTSTNNTTPPQSHHLHRTPYSIGGAGSSSSNNNNNSSSTSSTARDGGDAVVREQPPYPDDRVYTLEQFLMLQHAHAPLPSAILSYAQSLWKEMPENMGALPQNSSLRDNLFKGSTVTMPSKLLTDRKLHNEVMGILGKVTEANLEIMKRELTALPIRQSTEEEIHQVVHVFFNKSTRPEDSRYTPLYVKLIAHLVATIGSHEPAGKLIRTEVLNQCRETFMNASNDAKDLEKSIAHLPEEEANLARMRFTGRQKANVFFLGQMFVHRLVVETVVLAVLDNLLYGEGRCRRVPPDYCITHFIELLQTCGPHLSAAFYEKRYQRYHSVVEDLSRTYPQKRIQFILQNFVETMDNNWVPLHGPNAGMGGAAAAAAAAAGGVGGGRGAGGGAALAGRAGRGGGGAAVSAHLAQLRHASATPGSGAATSASSSSSRSPAPEARVKIPDREEFWRVMDDFFATGVVDDIVTVLASIPREVVVTYCSQWIGRYIVTYKYAHERTRLGELFELLVARHAITAATVREALIQHVYHALAEDLFVDQPKYFTHWAAVVRHGRSVFTSSLHTRLLNILVDNRASKAVVAKMVMDVHKALDESGGKDSNNNKDSNNSNTASTTATGGGAAATSSSSSPSSGNGVKAEQRDYSPHDRLRALPALLRYTPPMLEHDASPRDEDSILTDVRHVDIEVNFFLTLCESYDEGRTPAAMQCATEALKKSHSNAYPLIAAYFAFVRFDVDALCTSYKEVLKKLLNVRTLASLLEEVYVQWQALECPEAYYFAFVKRALATVNTGKADPLERLRERLRGEYGADKFVVQLDKYLK